MKSNSSYPGWAGLDGDKLRELREKENVYLEEYKGVFDNDLVFYVPRFKLPKFITRIQTFIISFRINWPIALEDVRKKLGIPELYVRNVKIHRNAWGCVLQGSIFINTKDFKDPLQLVRDSRRRIIKKMLSEARYQTSIFSIVRYLPLVFARIAVFCKDHRRRHLENYGLGEDLVCTIQVKKIKRIRRPDIFGSTLEQIGKYRIAWNKAWLENNSFINENNETNKNNI